MSKRHLTEDGEITETLSVKLLAICWEIKEFFKILPLMFLGVIISHDGPQGHIATDSQKE